MEVYNIHIVAGWGDLSYDEDIYISEEFFQKMPAFALSNHFISLNDSVSIMPEIEVLKIDARAEKEKYSFELVNTQYFDHILNMCKEVGLGEEFIKDTEKIKEYLLDKEDSQDTCGEVIKIKYHSDKIEKLTYIEGKSDWIDLRAAERVEMKKGDFKLINLGISMKLPEGYEAHILPRSSTYKNFGIIQTNSCGIIDNTYCGTDDVWKMPALAMKNTVIEVGDRICQFRIMSNQPHITFEEVDKLEETNRGGFGSTGKN